jgi:23S rRNA (adenine2503-C2)-methyltransferase
MRCSCYESRELSPPRSFIERFPEEWGPVLAEWREPRYRAVQIFHWIHKRALFDPEQMSDLPKSLREALRSKGLAAPTAIVDMQSSEDGTRKLLLKMEDGRGVESVLIPPESLTEAEPYTPIDDEDSKDISASKSRRVTQCVSSQIGCAMGCHFCASGKFGLIRQMTAAEIVSQVLVAQRLLQEDERIGNIVFMGVGEPLHNFDALARALLLLSHAEGQAISLRRMTVSTCGLVPGIDRLAEQFGGQVQLAVSLHSADEKTRSKLMPVNRKYPIKEVVSAMRRYPTDLHQRITVEYVMIRGVNDSEHDARRLAELLRGLRVKVNLIPMNSIGETVYNASSKATVGAFANLLRRAGIVAFVRRRRGDDIAAACGQLALMSAEQSVVSV